MLPSRSTVTPVGFEPVASAMGVCGVETPATLVISVRVASVESTTQMLPSSPAAISVGFEPRVIAGSGPQTEAGVAVEVAIGTTTTTQIARIETLVRAAKRRVRRALGERIRPL